MTVDEWFDSVFGSDFWQTHDAFTDQMAVGVDVERPRKMSEGLISRVLPKWCPVPDDRGERQRDAYLSGGRRQEGEADGEDNGPGRAGGQHSRRRGSLPQPGLRGW